MGASEQILEQYSALIATRLQQRDPAWLKQLRESAAARLQQSGLPTRRWESWHYSAADSWLSQFAQKQTLAPITPDLSAEHSHDLPAGHHIHFNHGYLVDQQLQNDEHADLGNERQAFSLLPLAQLDEKKHAPLITWLAALEPADPLANLAIALAPETWVLIVEANARVKQPIIFSHRNTKTGSQISQLIVWMQAGAEATVVEHFAADSASEYLQHARTATRLDHNSKLTHVRINRDSDRGQHLGTFDAQLGRDARLQLQVLENGCGKQQHNRIRNGIYVDLAEPNAEFIARGAFAASDMQHVDYHFCVNHNSDHGRSDVLMQGLAADASRGIVNGRIYIGKNTRANDGHFTSHNLLLSATAEINAKPELEIYADEVSCAHGATVGQLDEEQLFYMQTRGIDREQAVILLTEGFLKAGLLDCGNTMLNEFLQRQMLETLPKVNAPNTSGASS
ncbi:MAG: SufD family Fe-S cluster assembly protein [Spongiibacteraceae bacterium]